MKLPITSFFLSLSMAAALQAETNQFALKFQTGKTYKMHVENVTEMEMGPQGKMLSTIVMDTKAAAAAGKAPGTQELTNTIEDMKVSTKMGASEMPTPGLDALKGKTMGTVVIEESSGKFVSFAPAEGNDLAANPALASMLNAETMKQMYESPIDNGGSTRAVGDTWPFEKKIQTPTGEVKITGSVIYKANQTVDGHECAVLEIDAKMDMTPSGDAAKASAAMGMQIKDGSIKGTNYFDITDHVVRKSETTTSMTMSMKAGPDGKEMIMPNTTKTLTTTTVE
jgi:hypothetical protein